MTLRRMAVALAIGAVLVLTSCGGGSGGGSGGGAPPPANWDSMVWDQGNWG